MKINNLVNLAVLRLTAWYLLIVMFLSVGFSVYLYQVYADEFNRSLRREITSFLPPPSNNDPVFNAEQFRANQLRNSLDRLENNLLLFNLVILLLGGAASYLLAKRTLRPIEDSMDAQNRFITDASHELRTPLTVMRSEIEVGLRNSKLNLKESKKLLRSNLEEVVRLNNLSNNLLNLANYDQLKKKLVEKHKLNLRNVVEEVVKSSQKNASTKNIRINIKINGKIYVNFNKEAFLELLTILLDNAIKYSPSKKVINIFSSVENNKVILSVVDQGYGIRSSDIPHLFDRFYRADKSRTHQKVPGYGLGLAIAKQIVEINNSKINVKSIIGKGSTFSIILPLVKDK